MEKKWERYEQSNDVIADLSKVSALVQAINHNRATTKETQEVPSISEGRSISRTLDSHVKV